jgi:acyl-coenzyme A synthetase/AMP-(fatty) acid ligase
MKSLTNLLLSQNECYNDPAFITHKQPILWQNCLGHIARLAAYLKRENTSRWLLICEEAYLFFVGFFALLQTDKTVVLPHNSQINTLKQLLTEQCKILTDTPERYHEFDYVGIRDFDNNAKLDWTFKPLDNQRYCLELYTSGTTGRPKKTLKKLSQLEAEIQNHESLWGNLMADSAIVSTVSHQHIYGLLFRALWPVCCNRLIISENIKLPNELSYYLNSYQSVAFISSPSFLHRLPELLDISAFKSAIKVIFSSGSPLSTNAALTIKRHLGHAPIEVYGSTETGGIAYRRQNGANQLEWRCFESVQISAHQDDQTLIVQSPFLENESFFKTNDIIHILKDGDFLLLGRCDKIVKLEGKRVNINEIEFLLKQHCYIFDSVVIKSVRQKEVLAVIALLTAEGRKFLLEHGRLKLIQVLATILKEHIEPIALPRYWRFVDKMPFNSQGKLNIHELEQLFTEPKN